jgi:Mg/Co/Ni transporter MgtE
MKEQAQREDSLLSQLMDTTGTADLADFDGQLSERKSALLFRLTTEIEDAGNALKQAKQLVQKIENHLAQLKDLQKALAKHR